MKKMKIILIVIIIITPTIIGFILSELLKDESEEKDTSDERDYNNSITRIIKDTTWDISQSPIIIESDIKIENTAQLSITPGVQIELKSGNLDIEGNIVASGTDDKPIVFKGRIINLNLKDINYSNSTFQYCNFENITINIIKRNVSISYSKINNSILFFSESSNEFNNNTVINTKMELSGGHHKIKNNTYTNCDYGTNGYIEDGTIDLRDNFFKSSSVKFTHVKGNIYHNTFVNEDSESSKDAIQLSWSQVKISKNNINGFNIGIISEGNTSEMEIIENNIEDTITGINVINNGKQLIISRNHLENLKAAIDIFQGVAEIYVEITKNVIMNCTTGIEFDDYFGLTETTKILSKINNNMIISSETGISLTDTSVEIRNNNISLLNGTSIFFSCGQENFKQSKLIINYNILSEIRLTCNLSGVDKNFSYNYWDRGQVEFWCLNQDISDWFDPVLDEKPVVDLS